ncbi:hypothetical protein [Xanthomonas translucens]|uniref:hypothetical protein n=1 Tax=Xanthomonas campestris pv. translucens TaxID=343 RepID=UPI0002A7A0BB|nr:hypothetical protein [Xanthomonas translucens]ELQ15700.1 hypothetical protein A989_03482 [Xanthomonas translucens DAR61454]MBC3972841.1 hypothetical protein [Xanthomonas translucens pv. undulosa]MCT8281837.1 hypothetical protein [Xanthomonas translucens pv. undulosa]MCT8316409.1 hypothetical protein [Xanthomonas translucens pv. undulosa]QSQ58119.1 hypothetical protein ISN37_09385 [Xanthomonas translucens pv. undulosa]
MGILRKSFSAAREEGPAGVIGYLAVFIPTALIVLPVLPFVLAFIYVRELLLPALAPALPVKPARPVQPVVEHMAGVIDLAAVRQLRGEKPSHEG